jgi:YVTN family beta-propeller protein
MMILTIWRALLILVVLLPLSAQGVELKLLKTFEGAGAPKSVEISPDGQYAAIMNLEGMDFWLISTTNLQISKKAQFFKTPAQGWNYKTQQPIQSYAQKPVECAFSGDGRFLWISLHNAGAIVVYDIEEGPVSPNLPYERLKITDCITGNSSEQKAIKIPTEKTPKVIKVTPDEKYALVANWHSSSVSIIDVQTYQTIKNIRLGGETWYKPRGIAISSDSKRAYVANMRGGTISVIDLTTLTVIEDIPVTLNPRHVLLSKDQKTLYISDNILGKIVTFDLFSRKKTREVAIGKKARTIALSPDEQYVFGVSHDESRLVVADAGDLTILHQEEFPFPLGLAVTPDGKQLWVTSYREGMIGVYEIRAESPTP